MANGIEATRDGRAFYALPNEARSTFRRTVASARWGRKEPLAAFAAVGITDLLRHTLDMFDLAAAGLASLDEEDRAAAGLALCGQVLPTEAAVATKGACA
ncbi:hypothetical protein MKK84_15970 [Methylobacterium sp. E-065]|uniref:hypothetical protein n=1 Tax=Methylobacterium sp. E-065 TaxID=2836583 RepID=UPI001FBB9069|nr:hypothetical protein [Methylobacterium sp. E-065]MCJ2018921.1 hypothetical protein [Methylobacterium sp. E-065]